METICENFYDAAFRHWIDGCILENEEEYDNAVCMQGFAAECALKAILQYGLSAEAVRKYSHSGKELLDDIEMMLLGDMYLAALMDPEVGLRLSQILFPEVLFKHHPERRYYQDETYSRSDAESCREAVTGLIKEITRLSLDGYMGG